MSLRLLGLLDSSSKRETYDGNINAYISLNGIIQNKLQSFWRDPSKCACFCVRSDAHAPKLMCGFICHLPSQGCACWHCDCWVAAQHWGEGGISGYSKQTDSPSLKLSLEASDEMAQIMRHIINHRQGAAGSVYMCHTHSLPFYL